MGEANEIFQGRQACLTVVDGRSFLVVNLSAANSRDATTWGVTFLDLQDRGMRFQHIACDEGRGLQAGLREAELAIPLCPDLFHLLHDAHQLSRRLEKAAYQAIATAERARCAEREAQGTVRRRGRPLKVRVSRAEAETVEAKAIQTYDNWCWLLSETRQALEAVSTSRLASAAQSRSTLEAAVALLRELGHPGITAFAEALEKRIPQLLAPLEWLEQHLRPVLQDLAESDQAFIL